MYVAALPTYIIYLILYTLFAIAYCINIGFVWYLRMCMCAY